MLLTVCPSALSRANCSGKTRLSVVTYLHEFAHAMGRDERGACRWSLNLFRRVFPEQFARLRTDGHTVRNRETRR